MRKTRSTRYYNCMTQAPVPFKDAMGLYQRAGFVDAYLHFVDAKRTNGIKPDRGLLQKRWEICRDYCELMERRNWLLWRNPEFREDFRKVQQKTGIVLHNELEAAVGDRPEHILQWYYAHALLNAPMGRKFLARYKIPHFAMDERLGTRLEVEASFDLLLDLAYLKGLARRGGWGFEAENFRRDQDWYELQIEWREKATRKIGEKTFAWYLIENEAYLRGEQLTDDQHANRVAKLLAKNRIPMKYLVIWTDNDMPQEIDCMVVNSMRRQRDELLQRIGMQATKRLSDDRSRKLKDYEILHHLGIFLKARANKNWLRSQELWPAYGVDGDPIGDGSECYLRFDFNDFLLEGDDAWFKLLEARDDPKKKALRRDFLERRQDYLNKSDSRFAQVAKEAVNVMRKRIKTVIEFR